MRVVVQPYRPASQSARELAQAMGVRRLRPLVRTRFRPREGDVVINWGSGAALAGPHRYINPPEAVRVASNKIDSLSAMSFAGVLDGACVRVPEFTSAYGEAQDWLRQGHKVVQRAVVSGKAGEGASLIERVEDLKDAPLYTKYVPKLREFRVHVVGSDAIAVAEKRRRRGSAASTAIRTHLSGWVFCKYNQEGGELEVPQDVYTQAIAAVRAHGLDFGGVDVGWNEYYQQATVYEVNTAPGIEGSTVQEYAKALQLLINE